MLCGFHVAGVRVYLEIIALTPGAPATTKLLCAGRRQRTDLAERGHLSGRLLLLPPPGGYIKGPSDPAAQSRTDSTRRQYSRPPSNNGCGGGGPPLSTGGGGKNPGDACPQMAPAILHPSIIVLQCCSFDTAPVSGGRTVRGHTSQKSLTK